MKTENLEFIKLKGDEQIANIFYKAIMYKYPDMKNLSISYDGKNLTFDFDGDITQKSLVLFFVNDLVLKTTEKRSSGLDFERILNNTHEIMRGKYGDDYIEKMKSIPYIITKP